MSQYQRKVEPPVEAAQLATPITVDGVTAQAGEWLVCGVGGWAAWNSADFDAAYEPVPEPVAAEPEPQQLDADGNPIPQ